MIAVLGMEPNAKNFALAAAVAVGLLIAAGPKGLQLWDIKSGFGFGPGGLF